MTITPKDFGLKSSKETVSFWFEKIKNKGKNLYGKGKTLSALRVITSTFLTFFVVKEALQSAQNGTCKAIAAMSF